MFRGANRKVVCVGRNYLEHAKEMGSEVPREPLLFLKPNSSVVFAQPDRATVMIPPVCSSLHHEVELGIVIGEDCTAVEPEEAGAHIAGYVLALDMTARSLQQEAKKAGEPWTVSKGYDTFCPMSDFIPLDAIKDPYNVELWCSVNGEERQRGNTKDMIFDVAHLISHISSIMTLNTNDVILTGTPAGVGPVKHGDLIKAGITGVTEMEVNVENRLTPSE